MTVENSPVDMSIPSVDILINAVQSYNPNSNSDLIERAYEMGKKAHEKQFRKSGEPYFSHPFAVALLLTEIRLDDATIITALLHDVIEDTDITHKEVADIFGEDIADLVDGVTKITNLNFPSNQVKQAENLRKLLMAVSKDARVLLVKLADRLHNMRTLSSMPPEKQLKKAHETMDIFAPLAGRMGMQYIREELEDIAFSYLNPRGRDSIIRKIKALKGEHENLVVEIEDEIRNKLKHTDIEAEVYGREKRPYSIWRKIREKREGFQSLSDIYGFRIITNNIPDCYAALGVIHNYGALIPGRFKDYISQPKPNGYRSLHTSVFAKGDKRAEFQIRTRKMHFVAERGVAAHWAYKDGARLSNPYQVDPSDWLHGLSTETNKEIEASDFLQDFKMEMYSDQVFVFTPKGKVVKLPRGATAIDFAYAIHSTLGNYIVGASIDGERTPFTRPLKNGQTVKIIKANEIQAKEYWIDIAKTARARNLIRKALSEIHRDQDEAIGYEILRSAFIIVGRHINEKALERAAKLLGYQDHNALLVDIGQAKRSTNDVISALFPELGKLSNNLGESEGEPLRPLLHGVTAHSSRAAKCCFPIPGDRIVGIRRDKMAAIYHTIDCEELADPKYESKNIEWLDFKWPTDTMGAHYHSKIAVLMANNAGVLGRICSVIGENNANIENVEFGDKHADYFHISFDIGVRDKEHLHNIIRALEIEDSVAEAHRTRVKLSNEG